MESVGASRDGVCWRQRPAVPQQYLGRESIGVQREQVLPQYLEAEGGAGGVETNGVSWKAESGAGGVETNGVCWSAESGAP
jgi:hypothetical protein